MADYHRILSYLYRYDKKDKIDCKGFVKAEQRRDGLKLTLQIDDERLMDEMKFALCFYYREGEEWKLHRLAAVSSAGHHEETRLSYTPEQLPEGFDISKQYGIILFYQEFFYYGTVWIGDEIPIERLLKNMQPEISQPEPEESVEAEESMGQTESIQSMEPIESMKPTEPTEPRESVEPTALVEPRESIAPTAPVESIESVEPTESMEPIESAESMELTEPIELVETVESTEPTELTEPMESMRQAEQEMSEPERVDDRNAELSTKSVDLLQKMWIDTDKRIKPVENIFNPAFRGGYQILLEQLGKFSPEAGRLAGNQFLVKGCAIYHHLLAGKVIYAGKERYCVGVPGIYENRERYMAQLYQFPVFLSMTENRIKTGGFGYWLHLLQE